ncbi:MAG: hypothetical protein QW390_03840 [Candidatus Bathyarchaeia archaeon]
MSLEGFSTTCSSPLRSTRLLRESDEAVKKKMLEGFVPLDEL